MSVYVIAEIGSNHNGSYAQAQELIGAAAHAGADAVKFQCIPPLEPHWMPTMMLYAGARGLECSASVFDPGAVRELDELEPPWLKVASTEIVYDELLEAVAATERPVLLSTGMATFAEIDRAVRILAACDVTLLQCTVKYPTPASDVNLRAMVAMGKCFDVPVGLSDHTTSPMIPAAAAAMGASVIEKHITLDSSADGPDHKFALEPWEFRRMVRFIREIEQALGSPEKRPLEGEPIEIRGRRLAWLG